MSIERQGDIGTVVMSCMERWNKFSVADREDLLKILGCPISEAWYIWPALKADTRNSIIAEEMEYLVEKYREGYQEEANYDIG